MLRCPECKRLSHKLPRTLEASAAVYSCTNDACSVQHHVPGRVVLGRKTVLSGTRPEANREPAKT